MNQKIIPFIDFGGKGTDLHFAHANGFPPMVYRQFIQALLGQHSVLAVKHRPLWPGQHHSQLRDWSQIADDLIRFLDQQGLKNTIGMGHSLGGTASIIAAIKRPDLFRQLVLIDPVVFPAPFLLLNKLLPIAWRKKIVPPAKIALRRKDQWESKEAVYKSWRKKRVFSRLSDQVLADLVEYAIVPDSTKNGVTLAYTKHWEAQVYITAPYLFHQIKKLKIPMIVVRGQHTDVIFEKLWANWKVAQAHNHFIDFQDAGHLVPLEHPKTLAEALLPLIH
ncbi:MAG: alpha/beta hydrolase [Bacteroidota bacterium]